MEVMEMEAFPSWGCKAPAGSQDRLCSTALSCHVILTVHRWLRCNAAEASRKCVYSLPCPHSRFW